jgi:hypothetical protein
MKIKDGFVIRKVADCFVVMNLGQELDLGGMITLNETGALIWNGVAEGLSGSDIAKRITDEYEVSEEKALEDVKTFICKMKEAEVFE